MFPRPVFFQKIHSLDPTFEKLCGTHTQKKKTKQNKKKNNSAVGGEKGHINLFHLLREINKLPDGLSFRSKTMSAAEPLGQASYINGC